MPFRAQPLLLLARRTAAGRQRDAALRVDHAVPGYRRRRRQRSKDATDESRASRQAGARGDLAVAGDLAARNAPDCVEDPLLCLCFVHGAL